MKAFDIVVDRCFGVHLQGDYAEAIKDFSDKYRALEILVPLKVHLVEDHVVQFRGPTLGSPSRQLTTTSRSSGRGPRCPWTTLSTGPSTWMLL